MPNHSKSILVVDDDPKIRLLLRRCLESDGYNVVEAANSHDVDKRMQEQTIDLVTLDLQLGSDSGLNIAAKLRAESKIPIIMVTAKTDVIDKIVGLEMGADDYISKPFHSREVLARVHSVLRRSETIDVFSKKSDKGGTSNSQILAFDGWQTDIASYELKDPAGNSCDLTTADFKLLVVFLNSPKHVLSRDHIMDQINGYDWTPNDRTIDNQVARLRKRIELDPASPKIIKTIRGVGYMFTSDVSIIKN